MSYLADLYREEHRRSSASMIYQDSAQRPAPARLYDNSTVYSGLQQYQGKQSDRLAPRPGESPEAARRRLLSVARHLPEEEVEARLAAIDQPQQTHEQLRANLDARQSGVDRGLFGSMLPQDRAAVAQAHAIRANSMSDIPIAQNGGLGDSVGPAPARVFRSQIEQRPVFAQRSGIPAGSSGEGWSVTR